MVVLIPIIAPACINISWLKAIPRNNLPGTKATYPPNTKNRYFIAQTRWYLQSHAVTCQTSLFASPC